MQINGRRLFASLFFAILVALIAYLIIGSVVRDYDEGEVIENKNWVEKDGNGYVRYNTITLKRADGSVVRYDNNDDMIILKRNSDRISAALEEGKHVRLEVNLHNNITAIVPQSVDTNKVECEKQE